MQTIKWMTGLVLVLMLALSCPTWAQDQRFYRVAGPTTTVILGFTQDGNLSVSNAVLSVTNTIEITDSLMDTNDSAGLGKLQAAAGERVRTWLPYIHFPANSVTQAIKVVDYYPPGSMAFIPDGCFVMGDSYLEGYSAELPLHWVAVSAFYMDRYEVTKAMWDEVYQWAITNAYDFDNAGSGKASNHPVLMVNWYDVVKWSNARSEKEGRIPAYYTSVAKTTIYKTGRTNVANDWVKWAAGYRLPTEAEREKAARGGWGKVRFPWSYNETISHAQANYYSYWESGHPYFAYDVATNAGYHPAYTNGSFPYTSPVGSFLANNYGLCDMAGNVWEWCWDWFDSEWYSKADASQVDTRGPTSGYYRVHRGGGWYSYGTAFYCRNADRADHGDPPDVAGVALGFRNVLPLSP